MREKVWGLVGLGAGLLLAAAPSLRAELPYDTEYPAVGYSTTAPSDPFTRLMERVRAGDVELEYRDERGYLDSLMEALEIDPSSQVMVFSKTARKARLINSRTPRSIYFNDEVFLAFAQRGSSVEVAAMDPNIGPVFFSLQQEPAEVPEAEQEMNVCLRCHDSYSLSGGGVPRFMMSTVLVDAEGETVSHEVNLITDTSVPIERRWGGWYVTGKHGEQTHLGNLIIDGQSSLSNLDLAKTGNQTDLSEFFDVSPYPTPHSDMVALLVMEHQVEGYNAITRASFEARQALADSEAGAQAGDGDLEQRLAAIAEPLVETLLMAHEAPLRDEVSGTSGFAEYFESLGPFDEQGRSLRELDLRTRTFKYPMSYLVYTEGFAGLPDALRTAVYNRLDEILSGRDGADSYDHLDEAQRTAIREILLATHTPFARHVAADAS